MSRDNTIWIAKRRKQIVLTAILAIALGVGGLWLVGDAGVTKKTEGTEPEEQGEYADYIGWYEHDSGESFLLTWAAAGGLRILNFEDHTSRKLSPNGSNTFLWDQPKDSPDRKVLFQRDSAGTVIGFRWSTSNGQEGFAHRAASYPYAQAEVRFANADVPLVATLLIPSGQGPHPAVVFIHGSGTSDRDNLWYFGIADHLARNGIATLLPDKRGSGKSGGDWRTASFHDFARDALSGVALLRTHGQIDPRRIGLVGTSQGGWIAPLAASLSPHVSFVISVSGATVTPDEQLLHESKQTLIQEGFSPSVAGSMAPGAATIAKMRRLSWWRQNGNFDPIPHWEKLRVPVLVVYGEEDEQDNVPVRDSIARLEKVIQTGRNQDFTVKLFPDAGHGFLTEDKTWIRQDFLNLLARWIAERTRSQENPPQ